jgi:hypothetical protein
MRVPLLSKSLGWSCARVAIVATLAIGCAHAVASAQTDGLVVGDGQIVSIHENSKSLREIVIDLCLKAEVSLLGFAATDRTLSIDQDDLPMDQLLSRLLREESYMVGLKREGEDGVRISWLRVMGPESSSSALRFDEQQIVKSYFGMPKVVIDEAIASEDAEARSRAVKAVIKHVQQNPDAMDDFIGRGYAQLIKEIGDSPYSVDLLQSLSPVVGTNAHRFQIMGLVRSIQNYRDPPESTFKPLAILKELDESGALLPKTP